MHTRNLSILLLLIFFVLPESGTSEPVPSPKEANVAPDCTLDHKTTTESHSSSAWIDEEKRGQITTQSRSVDGSAYRAVRASMAVNASRQNVISAFENPYLNKNGCAQWRQQCKSSKSLEETIEGRILHIVLDLPWPVTDRELVVQSTVLDDSIADLTRLTGKSVEYTIPDSDLIRATTRFVYCVRGTGDDTSLVTYEMHTELNGGVPQSLYNSQVVDSTLEDMAALAETALLVRRSGAGAQ